MHQKLIFAALACASATPASASRIVYLAEQDHVLVNELYIVDLARPGETLKLNKPLSEASIGVGQFAISPDGSMIAFSADQETPGDSDLYVVDITAPGTWTKLGALPAGYIEFGAKFSPDGNKVAFTASERDFAATQLYVVDLADPGAATRVNGDLASGGAVSMTGFEFTPDGSHLVYVAGELERKLELYAVDLATPRHSVRLNAAGGSVGDTYEGHFRILPDGNRVVYSAVWQTTGMRELHVVSLDAPGIPTTLNAAFQAGGDVFDFAVSPDGRYITYTADQDTDYVHEVYLVAMGAPGIATKLNGPVQNGAAFAQFTPDSQSVIFAADGIRQADERDLYSVPVDLHMNAIPLSAPTATGEDAGKFGISADGEQVAYIVAQADGFARDLMVARADAPASAVKINGPLGNGTLEYLTPKFSPDGTEVAFIAVESIDTSIQELFFARVSAPGTSIRVNAPLAPEGLVSLAPDAFDFLPAGAPPTGSAPSAPTTSGNGSPAVSGGGGGHTGWLTLLVLLSVAGQRAITTVRVR
jgi:Tol biopolymer transport system component